MSSKYTNQLINESSPYLLQHAHNPVNWYPWGEMAIHKAKEENKLLLISIGYSACHWCHVMEHESFENEEIAQIMNENFICIKVDREERPDVDQIYMNAVQIITGSGGWPLNCFALPDGNPVYGGTYFKTEQWKYVLENLALSYKSNPVKFQDAAQDLKKGINQINEIIKIEDDNEFSIEDINAMISKLSNNFDRINGGFFGAPKFPMPVSYLPLMRFYYHSTNRDIMNHIELTLDKISNGGIYDHLGGGFARYTLDKEWLVPHFEKMLYDNAQLISLYSEAYRINPNPEYKRVVTESLDFVNHSMFSPEGGFYSSFDADSEGVEGKFYVWQKSEIDELLKDKSEIFCDYYDITEEGNWEGNNILHIKSTKEATAAQYNLSVDELNAILDKAKKVLFQYREKRVKPALDDKILTAWNALMLKAYVNAYTVFHEDSYLKMAEQNFEFIQENLLNKDFSLYRNFKDGKATIHAFLDDYALFIDSLINLYQATFKEKYIELAKNILDYVLKHFLDVKSSMFFYNSTKGEKLIARTIETNDNVIPSSNSVMAQNLFKLGHYYLNQDYIEKAKQMLFNLKDKMIKNPYYFANWLDLMIQFIYKPYEVCIVGEDADKLRKKFLKKFLPNILLAGGKAGNIPLLENRYNTGKTMIYACKNNVCNKPVTSFTEAMKIIDNKI